MPNGGNTSDSFASVRRLDATKGHKKNLLRQLNGVRIVAAMWVVLYHYQPQIYGILPELAFLAPVTGMGYLAVDLFFVLSGFIICYQYLGRFSHFTRIAYVRFLVKRLARIYPAHFAVLLALAVFVLGSDAIGVKITDPENYSASGLVLDLFLLRSWVGDSQGWNIPAWSLSAEWLAYVLYPVLALGVTWLAVRRTRLLLVAASLIVLFEGLATSVYPSSHMPVPAARILLAFSLGCVVYLLSNKITHSEKNGWLGMGSLVALLVLPASISVDGLRASVSLLLAGLVILLLATGSGRPIRLLGARLLNAGGLISFSLYLAHVPALMLIVRTLPAERFYDSAIFFRLAVAALYLIFAVAAGSFLYQLVERPAHKMLLNVFDKRLGGLPKQQR
ncbi:acyltransferase [Pseudarthrobacter sp. BRE9]|uniref:acyltransferase family protein n=1 Tax=Pseudarthrobacter sp. BRE9 TaxID=2962582 RepID=UPI00288121D8|nr:acyltransferase [Pseudarthrobacter sp. BRE9]MDT0168121.1 acyltransferase [Pseudarthrobacter sp. BRE9]